MGGMMGSPVMMPATHGVTKLFVGLPQVDIETEGLSQYFSRFGNVVDAIVMQKNGKPRGFGFVTFEDPKSAADALRQEHTMQGVQIAVKPADGAGGKGGKGGMEQMPPAYNLMCQMGMPPQQAMMMGGHPQMMQQQQPRRDATPSSSKLFVGGLAPSVDDAELEQYFGQFGTLIDSIVMKTRDGKPRGFGFVKYESSSSASEVLGRDHALGGSTLTLKPADGADRNGPQQAQQAYPPNLGGYMQPVQYMQQPQMMQQGGGYGGQGRGMMENPQMSSGYDMQDMQQPMGYGQMGGGGGGPMRGMSRESSRDHPYGGGGKGMGGMSNSGGGDRGDSGGNRSSSHKLFVGGLDNLEVGEFEQYFSQFGHVVDAVIMKDNMGRPRGFGFVSFDREDGVDNVLNAGTHTHNGKQITVKRADGKR